MGPGACTRSGYVRLYARSVSVDRTGLRRPVHGPVRAPLGGLAFFRVSHVTCSYALTYHRLIIAMRLALGLGRRAVVVAGWRCL